MIRLDRILYTAKAHTEGGREGGRSRTSDGRLDVHLRLPGGTGDETNPEQLFAVGWSACYLSAVKMAAARKRVALPADVTIDVEVDLGLVHGTHCLAARLHVTLPGLPPETANMLVDDAHEICPYSRATHGNVEVITTVRDETLRIAAAGR